MDLMSSGIEFQMVGAAKLNDRLPADLRLNFGIFRRFLFEDLSDL